MKCEEMKGSIDEKIEVLLGNQEDLHKQMTRLEKKIEEQAKRVEEQTKRVEAQNKTINSVNKRLIEVEENKELFISMTAKVDQLEVEVVTLATEFKENVRDNQIDHIKTRRLVTNKMNESAVINRQIREEQKSNHEEITESYRILLGEKRLINNSKREFIISLISALGGGTLITVLYYIVMSLLK